MIRLLKKILDIMMMPWNWLFAFIRQDRFVLRKASVVQFIGIPGSGKTMGAVCMMYRSTKGTGAGKYKNAKLFATQDAGCKIATTISTQDLATHKFRNSIIMIDESSLNGLDSREWAHNFKGDKKNILRQLKLHRHYGNSFITTSQSANDNDSKIRDGIVSQTWICHNRRTHVTCKRAIIWYAFDNGNYQLCIDEPSRFEMLCDPYLWYMVSKRKYGKYYDSWATVPEIDDLPEYGKKQLPAKDDQPAQPA